MSASRHKRKIELVDLGLLLLLIVQPTSRLKFGRLLRSLRLLCATLPTEKKARKITDSQKKKAKLNKPRLAAYLPRSKVSSLHLMPRLRFFLKGPWKRRKAEDKGLSVSGHAWLVKLNQPSDGVNKTVKSVKMVDDDDTEHSMNFTALKKLTFRVCLTCWFNRDHANARQLSVRYQ